MEESTYIQAVSLKTTLSELNNIKTDLAAADGLTEFDDLKASSQTVIRLTKRPLPASPPAALKDALASVESFLLAQAITAIQDQIDAAQLSFDELKDPES